jgi:cytoskeletal protein RodZ
MGERKRRFFQDPDRVPFLEQDGSAAAEPAVQDTLGVALRRAREGSGASLMEAAQHLRIRPAFLQALEDGRYKDLPGATYAIGFLRTYAEHLGLDPEVAVRRFKEESSGAIPRSELYMPKPVAESRIPGGTMLLAALVLGGAVYGGWYYLSSTGRELVDLVPPLPDQIAQVIQPPPGSPEAPAAEAQPGQPAPSVSVPSVSGPAVSGPVVPAPAASAPAAQAPAPQAQPAPASPSPAPSGQAVAVVPQGAPAPTPSAATPLAATPLAPAAPAPTAPAPTAAAPSASAPSAAAFPGSPAPSEEDETPAAPTSLAQGQADRAAAASPTAPPPAAPQAAPQAAEVPPSGRVYGATGGASRIQLRAVQDAWVQVRGSGGDLLFARVLRPGDVYRVPDQPGLRLVTGNAGGLQVAVDGAQGQSLGSTGQVLRDVPLDPARFGPR